VLGGKKKKIRKEEKQELLRNQVNQEVIPRTHPRTARPEARVGEEGVMI
jgi:hypothetical protein